MTLLSVGLVLGLGAFTGCRTEPKAEAEDASAGPVDLFAKFDQAKVQTPTADYVRRTEFAAGESRGAVYMHPPARVTFPPVRVALDSRLELSFAVADFEWAQGGDGVRFSAFVRAEGRDEVKLFSAYLDPKREPTDRRWHDADLALGMFAGQLVEVTLETDVGTLGDGTHDGAGWSRATVVSGRN